jgi:hypothetical protein
MSARAIALAALAALAALPAPAVAHDWYPATCCSGYDCQPVPASAVTVEDGQVVLRLAPGDHVMAPGGGEWRLPEGSLRPSPDGQAHACITRYSRRLVCLWAWFGG